MKDELNPVAAVVKDTPQNRAVWADWLAGTPGAVIALLWGFAEGTLFFVVPDVIISLAAIVRPRTAWRHVAAAIVGAVLGGAVLFSWSVRDPQTATQAIAHVPFVRRRMLDDVHSEYIQRGMTALFLGPLFGTPYKIYAVEAPEFEREPAFLLATAPARGERFLLVWAAFGWAGVPLRRRLRHTDAQLALVCAVFWVLLYSCYWGMILLR